MTWEHVRSHHQYTEMADRTSSQVKVRSATTGRWVWVRTERVRRVETPEEVREAEDFVRREHLQHLAWALSRELPFNLGTAVTNIALSGHGGSLLTALGALRDEIERTDHTGATTSEETHD